MIGSFPSRRNSTLTFSRTITRVTAKAACIKWTWSQSLHLNKRCTTISLRRTISYGSASNHRRSFFTGGHWAVGQPATLPKEPPKRVTPSLASSSRVPSYPRIEWPSTSALPWQETFSQILTASAASTRRYSLSMAPEMRWSPSGTGRNSFSVASEDLERGLSGWMEQATTTSRACSEILEPSTITYGFISMSGLRLTHERVEFR
mmetsp:Transcript_22368/g.30563  ORF Transcript_22368/g.30563 Transcript_22368/m.30563 type:complete len:205 (+) Transcript_22368:182-796(+)